MDEYGVYESTPIKGSNQNSATKSTQNNNSNLMPQDLIKVCVRIRPLLKDEKDQKELMPWSWYQNSIAANPITYTKRSTTGQILEFLHSSPNTFTFDHLFDPESNNTEIFESCVKKVVGSSMGGFHGSVFTYGQTSSGKTYTMNGAPNQPGVIPQAICYCFQAIDEFPDREFLIRVSYIEVYNEQLRDLLNVESTNIKLQFDPKLGTVLSGVKEQVVLNYEQVITLIKLGETHRHIGSTNMNEKSSRAHTIFKIIVESKERGNLGSAAPVRVSTLNLVDLAGSENAKMTNSKGERAKEAKFINQSLLTLSTIIQRLSEDHQTNTPSKTQHLPYRDSKLTRLLENALNGNAYIVIICTISPTLRCLEESTHTLKFGQRAKFIRLQAKVNEQLDDKTLLKAYRQEIEELKLKLKELEAQQILQQQQQQLMFSQQTPSQTTSPSTNNTTNNPYSSPSSNTNNNNNNTTTSNNNYSTEASDKIEEEQLNMLAMIEEMEKLILKADVTKTINKKPPRLLSHESMDQIITINNASSLSMLDQPPSSNVEILSTSSLDINNNGNNLSSNNLLSTTTNNTANNRISQRSKLPVNPFSSKRLSLKTPQNPFENNNDNGKTSPNSSQSTQENNQTQQQSDEERKSYLTQKELMNESIPMIDDSMLRESSASIVFDPPKSGQHSEKPGNKQTNPGVTFQEDSHEVKLRQSAIPLSSYPNTRLVRTLTREKSMQLDGLLQFYSKLENNAEKLGITASNNDLASNQVQKHYAHSNDVPALLAIPSNDSRDLDSDIGRSLSRSMSIYSNDGNTNNNGVFVEEEEENTVLTGVSKMLLMLKDYISKTNVAHRSSHHIQVPPQLIDHSPQTPSPTESMHITTSPQNMNNNNNTFFKEDYQNTKAYVPRKDFDQLKLELQLKEADNHFLQQELENKDSMLTMLTEGLKEVRESQMQWTSANQQLSYELEKALQVNELLTHEIQRLSSRLAEYSPEFAQAYALSPLSPMVNRQPSNNPPQTPLANNLAAISSQHISTPEIASSKDISTATPKPAPLTRDFSIPDNKIDNNTTNNSHINTNKNTTNNDDATQPLTPVIMTLPSRLQDRPLPALPPSQAASTPSTPTKQENNDSTTFSFSAPNSPTKNMDFPHWRPVSTPEAVRREHLIESRLRNGRRKSISLAILAKSNGGPNGHLSIASLPDDDEEDYGEVLQSPSLEMN